MPISKHSCQQINIYVASKHSCQKVKHSCQQVNIYAARKYLCQRQADVQTMSLLGLMRWGGVEGRRQQIRLDQSILSENSVKHVTNDADMTQTWRRLNPYLQMTQTWRRHDASWILAKESTSMQMEKTIELVFKSGHGKTSTNTTFYTVINMNGPRRIRCRYVIKDSVLNIWCGI